MADIKSFPNNQDVYIGAEPVMRWLHGRTSGVFGGDGNLAVEAVGSYAVTVSDGTGWMSNANGDGIVFWVDNQAQESQKLRLVPEISDQVLPRIDRVVVTWETTDYVALPTVTILKGTAASNPQPPSLTNNTLRRQISLARIQIPAGASTISSSMITDERLDSSVCGIVTGSVEFDTTVMQAQFEELLSQIETELEELNAGTSTMLKTVYDPDNLGIDLGVQIYTHNKSGSVHRFNGHGKNGIAKITAPFNEGDEVRLNGYVVNATCGADKVGEDTFVEGQWVSFVADQEGDQINFKGGGGLGSSKLAAATATTAHVLSGDTFYAKDKNLKTGTMKNHGQITNAVSVGNDSSGVYVRLDPGAYIAVSAGSGYPEVKFDAGTATPEQVLNGATFISNKQAGKATGTMTNRGAWTGSVGVAGTVSIPNGYHNGSGRVTGPSSFSGEGWGNANGSTVDLNRNESNQVATGFTTVEVSGRISGRTATITAIAKFHVDQNGNTSVPGGDLSSVTKTIEFTIE